MSKEKTFIHAFIEKSGELDFDAIPGELKLIEYNDVLALITQREEQISAKHDNQILANLLLKHQQYIEVFMNQGFTTILPVKLNTSFDSQKQVKAILEESYPFIKREFNEIRNKVEYDVVCTWADFNSVLNKIGSEPEIIELKDAISKDPSGPMFDDQMRIGMLIKKYIDQLNSKIEAEIETKLKEICLEMKANQTMNDQMIGNLAVLLDKSSENAFDRRIRELDHDFKGTLNFRCIGPLPAYNFFTIESVEIGLEAFRLAKNQLGLKDRFSLNDIKRAYKTRAFDEHPDTQKNREAYNERFNELNKSYKLLSSYAEAFENMFMKEHTEYSEELLSQHSQLLKLKD